MGKISPERAIKSSEGYYYKQPLQSFDASIPQRNHCFKVYSITTIKAFWASPNTSRREGRPPRLGMEPQDSRGSQGEGHGQGQQLPLLRTQTLAAWEVASYMSSHMEGECLYKIGEGLSSKHQKSKLEGREKLQDNSAIQTYGKNKMAYSSLSMRELQHCPHFSTFPESPAR